MVAASLRLVIAMIISLFVFSGCVGPAPKSDMSLATVALESAREAQAAKYAPGLFRQAEEHYQMGLTEYEEKRYAQARESFLRAKQYAEKAENYTVLKKAERGESE